jgi:hypothetical protein
MVRVVKSEDTKDRVYKYNEETRMHTEFWYGNLFVNVHLKDREGDGRIPLR